MTFGLPSEEAAHPPPFVQFASRSCFSPTTDLIQIQMERSRLHQSQVRQRPRTQRLQPQQALLHPDPSRRSVVL